MKPTKHTSTEPTCLEPTLPSEKRPRALRLERAQEWPQRPTQPRRRERIKRYYSKLMKKQNFMILFKIIKPSIGETNIISKIEKEDR